MKWWNDPFLMVSLFRVKPKPSNDDDESEKIRNLLKRQEKRLLCLHQLTEVDASRMQIKEFFQAVFNRLKNIVSYLAAGALIFEYGHDRHLEYYFVGNNRFNIEDLLLKSRPLRMNNDLNMGRPLYFADLSKRIPSFPLNSFSRSQLCLPLRNGDQLLGVLIIESDQLDTFDLDLQQFLQIFATLVASSVQTHLLRFELSEKQNLLTKRSEWIAALTEIFQFATPTSIQQKADLKTLSERIVNVIQQGLDLTDVVIAITPTSTRGENTENYTIHQNTLSKTMQPVSRERIQQLILEGYQMGRFTTLGNIKDAKDSLAPPSSLWGTGGVDVLLIPLHNFNGETIGFILIYVEKKLPSHQTIQMLEILATLLARSIGTNQINNEIKTIRTNYNQLHQEIITKQKELIRLKSDVSTRNSEIVDLRDDLQNREQKIHHLQNELAEKEAEFTAITAFQPSHLYIDSDYGNDFDLLNMYNLSLILNSTMNIDDILTITAEQAIQITRTQACKISIVDKQTGKPRRTVSFGVHTRFKTSDEPPAISDIVTEWVITHQTLLAVSDMKSDERFKETNLVQVEEISSSIAVPLKIGEELIGVLQAHSYDPLDFTESNTHLLSILATQAAISLNNAQQLQEKQRLAVVDELTGVYNYRYFRDAIQREIQTQRNYPLAMLMLDVDNLKPFNDRHGHLYGSEALRQIAGTIVRYVSPADIVAKYGGDEFAAILMETNKEQAFNIAEKIRKEVESTNSLTGDNQYEGHLTVCIGIAECPQDANTPDTLINAADQALYRAKHRQRNMTSL